MHTGTYNFMRPQESFPDTEDQIIAEDFPVVTILSFVGSG